MRSFVVEIDALLLICSDPSCYGRALTGYDV